MVIEPSTWYGAVVNSNTLMCSPREDTRNDMSLLSLTALCMFAWLQAIHK